MATAGINSSVTLDKAACQSVYSRIQTTDLFFSAQKSWSFPTARKYVEMLFKGAPQAKTALRGKLAVVTGVTMGGTGYYIAEELAVSAKMAVVLLGRNMIKLQHAAASIGRTAQRRKAGHEPDLFMVSYDLNCLRSAATAAEKITRIAQKEFDGRLDVLINNAGCSVSHYSLTEEGVEALTGRNFLTPHHLTTCLLPLLRAAATPSYRPRIVLVASLAHCKGTDFDPDQLKEQPTRGGAPVDKALFVKTKNGNDYKNGMQGGLEQHSRAKMALVADGIALAKSEPSLCVVSLHPGSIISNFGNALGVMGYLYYYGFYLLQLSASQGARAALRAALDPDFNTETNLRQAYLHADGEPWCPCDPTTLNPSTGTNQPYTMEEYADRVKQVADELCVKLLEKK